MVRLCNKFTQINLKQKIFSAIGGSFNFCLLYILSAMSRVLKQFSLQLLKWYKHGLKSSYDDVISIVNNFFNQWDLLTNIVIPPSKLNGLFLTATAAEEWTQTDIICP